MVLDQVLAAVEGYSLPYPSLLPLMAGDDSELHVMLCASGDGQGTAVHLDHHFVPCDWLKREFPKHFELIEIIESRAQLTMAATFQQHEG